MNLLLLAPLQCIHDGLYCNIEISVLETFDSSHFCSSNPIVSVLTFVNFEATDSTEVESIPPLKKTPVGTSLSK